MSDKPKPASRINPYSQPFRDFIGTSWRPFGHELPDALPASRYTPARRRALSARFPSDRLVLPAGCLRVRSNDTDYRFRPHSAFVHMTGLGTEREPDAVLVLEPSDDGHEPTLYFKPRASRTEEEFYADTRYGEMWVGQRESLAEMSALTGIRTAPLAALMDALTDRLDQVTVRLVREADADLTQTLDDLRLDAGLASHTSEALDDELEIALDELRLIKDAFELEQMRTACAATATAFTAVVRALPEAVRRRRGERWIEGVFALHARHLGNGVGYETISASAEHATTLHWIRNDGDLRPGDLVLIDAGVEIDSLYTADVTRTLPVSGTFTSAQREVYLAVLDAQKAGLAAARPGATFADVHKAAIAAIARHVAAWGILPVTAEASLHPETGGHHRRWMVHGTSHHLGLDVHDCASLPASLYRDAILQPGMVITVEPGLYFKSDDLLVPERFRGIGIRIEDDIVITEDGNEILSDALPREPDAVEAWMASLLG